MAAGQAREQSAVARVVLICSSCELAWEPDLLAVDEQAAAMSSGCPRCGGWTWLGELR